MFLTGSMGGRKFQIIHNYAQFFPRQTKTNFIDISYDLWKDRGWTWEGN